MRPGSFRPSRRLAVVVGALLLPIWLFPFFPSQDGPSHVANAALLLDLLRGGTGAAHGLYVLNLAPFPNWLTHASLAALLTVLSPTIAEKVLLTSLVALLVLAFRYALAGLDADAEPLAALCVPFVYDRSLHLGYYNRGFALVAMLFALGFWIRRRGRLSPLAVAFLAALLLLVYFSAAMTLLVTWLALSALVVGVTLAEAGGGSETRERALFSRIVRLAFASLPAAALLWWFRKREGAGVATAGEPLAARLRGAVTLDWLVALDAREWWLSGALAAVLGLWVVAAVLARRRRGGWHEHDGLLAALAVAGVAYLAAPAVAIVGHGPWGAPVHDRIAPHLSILLILWLAVQPVAARPRRALLVAVVALGLGLVALRLPRYSQLNDSLAEYLSAAVSLPPGAALLPLSFDHEGHAPDGKPLAVATWPFRHAADRLVVSRAVLNLDNYEAQVSFFPVAWRPGYEPYRLLGSSLDRLPGCVHLGRFNRASPRPADFLVVWGAGRVAWNDDPCAEELRRTIQVQYRRVFVSVPRGQVEVYRRIGGEPEATTTAAAAAGE